jgi:ribosomal protein S20
MPEEAQTTVDEPVNNTGAEPQQTQATQAATEAQPEKTFTQADVDRIINERLKTAGKSLVKKELQKLLGEDAPASVEELQAQLSASADRIKSFEVRDAARDFLSDPKHNIRPENIRAIEKLILPDLVYENGRITNLKEAVESAKSLAPALFNNPQSSFNGNNGRQSAPLPADMNSIIRSQAGYGS